jgi:hypothetical protein
MRMTVKDLRPAIILPSGPTCRFVDPARISCAGGVVAGAPREAIDIRYTAC